MQNAPGSYLPISALTQASSTAEKALASNRQGHASDSALGPGMGMAEQRWCAVAQAVQLRNSC